MSSLSNKRILVGITGGIAAYKSCEIVRKLKAYRCDVRVVMTEGAQAFITPLTLQALSGNPVHTALLDPEAEAGMGHIELAKWADIILVAPASADFIAKTAQGLAGDLLSTLLLATEADRYIAPAMNQSMYQETVTQDNIQQLMQQAYQILGPGEGEQACGDVGPGRMLEPLEIVEAIAQRYRAKPLSGKHIVITAGPTREPLDPVRYLSNHSSGKMGYALASQAIALGASVCLISGPVALVAPERCELIQVESAVEMLNAALKASQDADIFIASAAVADYRPAEQAVQKIKKSNEQIDLQLVKNPDIIATVSQRYPELLTVGFAAETEQLIDHAKAKLMRKG
ncbi:MAG: bifunctional phosphopantothenoylcysteine decarboxylase/phosphopantothenate--cysteine ligase CoaBC, partial [Pseudomonadales bacterium]|nr:bifunctional phosphopantothenoylcysteine decarboxylase/phosphopantothenate--cysteine ligase CoaBC [Pseudomonadales bacterium]